MYSYGPLHMAEQKQDDQLKHTYSSYVRIWDVAQRTCQRRWTIGRSGERVKDIRASSTTWWWCIASLSLIWATKMNIQCNQELLLYEFKLGHNTWETTKKICCVKCEGTIDHNPVTRGLKYFTSVAKTSMIKKT